MCACVWVCGCVCDLANFQNKTKHIKCLKMSNDCFDLKVMKSIKS